MNRVSVTFSDPTILWDPEGESYQVQPGTYEMEIVAETDRRLGCRSNRVIMPGTEYGAPEYRLDGALGVSITDLH